MFYGGQFAEYRTPHDIVALLMDGAGLGRERHRRSAFVVARISDFTVVPYPLEHASCPDCAGFRHEEPATEGDTQWVNYKPSPFSSRSTGF